MPDRENHIFKKGLDFAELGQYTEALVCFDQAVALNPDDASAWNNRGIILGELEDIPKLLPVLIRQLLSIRMIPLRGTTGVLRWLNSIGFQMPMFILMHQLPGIRIPLRMNVIG